MIFPNLKFRGVEDNGITVPILIFLERKKLRIKAIETIYLTHFTFFPGQSVYGQDKSLPYVPVTQGGNGTGRESAKPGSPGLWRLAAPSPRGSGPRIRGHEDSRPCIAPIRMDLRMSAD